MENNIKKVTETNVGRAMEALELAGVENETLKRRIRKLIYFTADDIERICKEGEGKDGMG